MPVDERHGDQRQHQGPEALERRYWKFIPKKPVRKVSGIKIVATAVKRFMTWFKVLEICDKCTSSALDSRSR